jgi:nucleotide-binding universal stress UspA family protein
MTTQTLASQTRTRTVQLFEHVLVGIDPSAESIEAARQAAVLVEPGGTLTLLGAWSVPPPTVAGVGVYTPSNELNAGFYRQMAEEAVATAMHGLAPLASPATKVARGLAWEELTREPEASGTTLIVVGSHGQARMHGILIGSTATEIVHKAPCSVLVAREADALFPRRIVIGVEGSAESATAYAVACELAARFGSELWPVVAHGGDGVDKEAVARIVDDHHENLQDEPVEALVAAAADADLLVVGSRGLHGLKALGSVSERVAHRARCSTLIVRSASDLAPRLRDEA